MAYLDGECAEAVIQELMDDDEALAGLIRRIRRALDAHDGPVATGLATELARAFAHHATVEEAGLFEELQRSGAVVEGLGELVDQDHQILRALRDVTGTSPDRLRGTLALLSERLQREEDGVFLVALQDLPLDCWERVDRVHQRLLAE